MICLKLLIALIIPFLLGLLGISAILRERLSFFAYFERLAIAFALGVWMLVLIMFSLPFLGIALTFQNIALAAALILILLATFSLRSLPYFLPERLPGVRSSWFYLLLFVIAIKTLFVFWSALIEPVIGPDLMTYYALAAKHTFIFATPLHLYGEPPLPFLIQAWTPINLGTWNDSFLPFFFPFLYLGLLLVFFCTLKRHAGELYSLFFTFLLASAPFLLHHAGTAYADFPMAFYYSIATIYLFQFFREFKFSRDKALAYLLASLIFLGISIWVKKSGIYYAGINFSVLAAFLISQRENVRKIEWESIGRMVLLFAIIALPWLVYSRLLILLGSLGEAIPSLKGAVASPVLWVRDMSWLVVFAMFRNMFMEGNWQLLWMLFISLLVLYPRKAFRSPNSYLLAIIILQLAALFVLFRFTEQFPYIMDDTLLNRLTLHFVPVVLYFCAELFATPPPTPEAQGN
jgi:hypothetical protein